MYHGVGSATVGSVTTEGGERLRAGQATCSRSPKILVAYTFLNSRFSASVALPQTTIGVIPCTTRCCWLTETHMKVVVARPGLRANSRPGWPKRSPLTCFRSLIAGVPSRQFMHPPRAMPCRSRFLVVAATQCPVLWGLVTRVTACNKAKN